MDLLVYGKSFPILGVDVATRKFYIDNFQRVFALSEKFPMDPVSKRSII